MLIYMGKRCSSGLPSLRSQKRPAELQKTWFLWVFFGLRHFSPLIISVFSWPTTVLSLLINYSQTLLKFGFNSGKYISHRNMRYIINHCKVSISQKYVPFFYLICFFTCALITWLFMSYFISSGMQV